MQLETIKSLTEVPGEDFRARINQRVNSISAKNKWGKILPASLLIYGVLPIQILRVLGECLLKGTTNVCRAPCSKNPSFKLGVKQLFFGGVMLAALITSPLLIIAWSVHYQYRLLREGKVLELKRLF
ncbi:hypothetical protein PHSC3_000059 [Chlamydiales bacterium STE3]|nr:hypothetical protein PHSC3_000059 [Chlamydiales bacterium STE3]